jgi:anti-anti-sigma factor
MGSLALRQVRRVDGSLVLTVSGVVDDATVECFEQGLDRATGTGSHRLIIDLTTCRLDSAGLAALVRLRRRSGHGSARMRLVAPDPDVFRMLEIIGLTSQFPTYATMDAALPSPQRLRRGSPGGESRSRSDFPDAQSHVVTARSGPRTPHPTSMDGAALPPRVVR